MMIMTMMIVTPWKVYLAYFWEGIYADIPRRYAPATTQKYHGNFAMVYNGIEQGCRE